MVILDSLTAQAAARRAALAQTSLAQTALAQTATAPPLPATSSERSPRDAAPVGVQRLLVTVGSFLLAVAVIGFLAFSWSSAGLGTRAILVATVTSAVIALAVFLRPRLPSTAEAVAALAVVLCLCDIWAARATGLPWAAAPAAWLYTAVTLSALGGCLVAGGRAVRLRSWSLSGGALVAAGAGALGVWLVASTSLPEESIVTAPAASAALVTGVVLLSYRRRSTSAPEHPALAWVGARIVYAALLLPVIAMTVWQGLTLPSLIGSVWDGSPGTSLAALSDPLWAGGDQSLWLATTAGMVLIAVTSGWLVIRPSQEAAVRTAATGLAALLLCIGPDTSVLVAVVMLGGLTSLAGAATTIDGAQRWFDRTLLWFVVAFSTGSLLLVAWTAEALGVPVTALLAGAALWARRAVHAHGPRVVLAMIGSTLGLVAATVAPVWLGYPADGAVPLWALVTSAVVLFCAFGPYVSNRSTILLTTLVVHTAWLVVASWHAAVGDGDTALALAFWLSTVVVVALVARAHQVVPKTAGRALGALSAFALPLVLSVTAVYTAEQGWTRGEVPRATVAAGAVLLVALGLAGCVARFGSSSPGGGAISLVRAPARRTSCEAGLIVLGVLAMFTATVDGALDGSGSGAGAALWLPMLLLGAAAGAIAMAPDRRGVRWLAWALLTGSWWARLGREHLPIEVYSLPPAAALFGLGLLQVWRRAGGLRELAGAFLPSITLALMPSLWASAEGSPLRTVVLLALAAAFVGIAALIDPAAVASPKRPYLAGAVQLLTSTGVVLGAATLAVRVGVRPVERVELYAAAAAVPLVIAAAVRLELVPGLSARLAAAVGLEVTSRTVALCGALVVLATPTLVVAAEGYDTVRRAVMVESLTALIALGTSLVLLAAPGLGRRSSLRDGLWVWSGLSTAICALAAVIGASTGNGPLDAWTLAAGLSVTAFGATTFRRAPGLGSWLTLGPGVVLTLVPSLVIAVRTPAWLDPLGQPAAEGAAARAVLIVSAATVCVLVGLRSKLSAPLFLGLGALAWYGLHVLGPTLLGVWHTAPAWLTIGCAGAALLYVGATAERRLKDVAAAKARLGTLR